MFLNGQKGYPKREIEHHIHLKKNTNPVNVRPYRYAYVKAKMEKLEEEMLASGVIRPSTNPYLSLVLLVRERWEQEILC